MFLSGLSNKEELGVTHTHKEILQQPKLWKKTYEYILSKRKQILSFIKAIENKHESVKVILTGAGTSAYIGECITPYLNKTCRGGVFHFNNIPTTHIVSNPYDYLDRETPTLMISFARSGNSPESIATVELGRKIIKNFYEINITCNRDGYLAKGSNDTDSAMLLLMPEESNDQGFAMTSSFTSMMLAAILLFKADRLEDYSDTIHTLSDLGEHIFQHDMKKIEAISKIPFTNIVYLGSGPLSGLSHEASLKMLELTRGNVNAVYESPLGFRHGPKSIINDKTLVVMFLSSDDYTQKYDLDMLKELFAEKDSTALKLVALSDKFIPEAKDHSDFYFAFEGRLANDYWLGFLYILYAQTLAVYKSLSLGIKPDNPDPTGSVNRVVKGVTIHPLH